MSRKECRVACASQPHVDFKAIEQQREIADAARRDTQCARRQVRHAQKFCFSKQLQTPSIAISLDGRGSWRDSVFVEPAKALRFFIEHFVACRTPGASAPYDCCFFTEDGHMRRIDRAGKQTADAASPTSEGSSVPGPSSTQLDAPAALRRRTDSGYVAGDDRADVAPRQAGLLPPSGVDVPLSNANPVAPHIGPSSPLPTARLHLVHEATSDAHLPRPGTDTSGNIGDELPFAYEPGAAPFAQLLPELQLRILDHLPSDAPSKARSLIALSGTSQALRALVQGVDSFPEYRLLGRLMQAAEREVSNCRQLTPKLVKEFASTLELLGPEQQERLVSATIGFANSIDKADAIAALSAKVAHLSEGQRERLVAAAIGLDEDNLKAPAIDALGANAAHLNDSQRETLVVAAIALANDGDKAHAIVGLGAGAAHLKDSQRERLVAAAIGLDDDDHKAGAIAGLVWSGMAHLKVDQRERLFTAALGLPGSIHLAALGVGMEHLNEDQREQLVTAALDLPANYQAHTMAGLAAGMEHLNEDQREQLVVAAIEHGDSSRQARAIRGLGTGMAHLSDSQRKRLVAAAIRIPDADDRASAIAGLGEAAEHLSDSDRKKLVAAAIGFDYCRHKSEAINGLAAGAEHLSEYLREELVVATIGLSIERFKAQAIAGLGAGAAHLSEGQREELVVATIGLSIDGSKAYAIAGLGAGLAHLDVDQRERLFAAAISLANVHAKAQAIAGLAASIS